MKCLSEIPRIFVESLIWFTLPLNCQGFFSTWKLRFCTTCSRSRGSLLSASMGIGPLGSSRATWSLAVIAASAWKRRSLYSFSLMASTLLGTINHHKTCEFNAFHTDSGEHFDMGPGAFARLARAFAGHARSHHTESGTAGFSTRATCSLVRLLVRRESPTQ